MDSTTRNTNFATRGNIPVDDKKLPFVIRTSDVKEYLQKKVNFALEAIKREEAKKPPEKRRKITNVSNINLSLMTTRAGKKFFPFVVILPMDVLDSGRSKNEDIPEIFRPEEAFDQVKLMNEFWQIFQPYVYNKADAEAFMSPAFRRQVGMSMPSAREISRLRTMKITRTNDGNAAAVTFMLDPIRLFYDMLKPVRVDSAGNPLYTKDGKIIYDNRNYQIDVFSVGEMSEGNYVYKCSRIITTPTKESQAEAIKNALTDMISGKRGYVNHGNRDDNRRYS